MSSSPLAKAGPGMHRTTASSPSEGIERMGLVFRRLSTRPFASWRRRAADRGHGTNDRRQLGAHVVTSRGHGLVAHSHHLERGLAVLLLILVVVEARQLVGAAA